MGRHTEIYIFDRDKASNALYDELRSGTFKDFVAERKAGFGDEYNISLQEILETVHTDINKITPEAFFEISLYLNEVIHQRFVGREDYRNRVEAETKETYERCGLYLLYDIVPSTVCYSYMFQYGNFTDIFPVEEIRNESGGVNISASDFLRFNDYMILLTSRLVDLGLGSAGEYDDRQLPVIRGLREKYSNDTILREAIDKEVEFLASQWHNEDSGPEKATIYSAEIFLGKSIEMRSSIDPSKNTRIIISDSI